MSESLSPVSDITQIRGIGSKKKSILASAGIRTVGDLLGYFPYKYSDRRTVWTSASAPPDRDVMVKGKLIKVRSRNISGSRSMVECSFRDRDGIFDAVFFNMPYLARNLKTGDDYILYGKMKLRNGARIWTNPELIRPGSERDVRGIVPVYRCPSGITNQNLSRWISEAIDRCDLEEDWLDPDLISERKLCSREFAVRNIHFPASEKHYKAARYRIIYEQLLIYQISVRSRRKALEEDSYDSAIEDEDISPFIDSLPFGLTPGQSDCIKDIEKDLVSKRPMNRLIQGDVGCGKTVVAECAVYKCVKAGSQAAMMAPTEVLARQHYQRLSEDLGKHGIKVVLLTSGMRASERRELLEDIKSGKANVVTGTHALIQNDVEFGNLALVITDEQHRFGVEQRKSLNKKGRSVNVCVMSATPIPRTMAATVFGDMDFSIIRSMPSDRKKIITRALGPESRERAYIAVKDEISKGNLAYIVAPSIDSEEGDMESAEKLFREVSSRFRGYRTGLLHGRMTGAEKEAVMADFAAGRYNILVSTVVIEVGIDVRDATIMVIENSERFGLAQMHQLRGRVGRNDRQSYCYLINYSRSESAVIRAKTMAEISDGFEISEADYAMRGPGDITGTLQSGNVSSNILDLCRYTEILDLAIKDADRLLSDPGKTDTGCAYRKMAFNSANDNSNVL